MIRKILLRVDVVSQNSVSDIMNLLRLHLTAFLMLSSGIFAEPYEIDRRFVSPRGFAAAKVSVKASNAWISDSAECTPSEKFPTAEKSPGGLLLTIQAENLVAGLNKLYLCQQPDGNGGAIATALEIHRDDTQPVVKAPEAGEYAVLPPIELSSNITAHIAYTLDGSGVRFNADGSIQNGQQYTTPIRGEGAALSLTVQAISKAGVSSEVARFVYRINRRLAGLSAWDLYVSGAYFLTSSSVKSYLPNGVMASVGARRGLDDLLLPHQSDVRNRPPYIPLLWGEVSWLQLDHNPYTERLFVASAGPEWQIGMAGSRTLLLAGGLGFGGAHASITTPAYSASGVIAALQAYVGLEYDLGLWAIFGRARYLYFADQSAPLTGLALTAGIVYKL